MSSEDIGGIRVQRETVIVVEDNPHVCNRRDGSPATTTQSNDLEEMDSQVSQYSRPKTFRKLSNASSIITDIFRADTDEDALRRKIKRANDRDSSRDLIEFLRNTSPPPQNYMSIPDTFDSPPVSKKKRRPFWSFWKKRFKRGKKKDGRPASGVIRLPDTAVAGRTTGGYRHIAISIPIEYDHLEELTQEPTPPASDDERADPVTVLSPVVEEKRESIKSITSGTTTSSISAESEELFSMLPSPESPMERLSTDRVLSAAEPMAQGGTGSCIHSRPASRMANSSVGAHSMITTIPSPRELTPLPKGSISDPTPVDHSTANTRPQTNTSMKDNRLERIPTKESFYTVKSDPRSRVTDHPAVDTKHDVIAVRTSGGFPLQHTPAAIQALLETEQSGTEDIASSRYCMPMSPHPLSFQSRVASIFPPLEPFSPLPPKPKTSCPFRITPIMTVVDVQPVSARQSPAPRLKEQHSLVSKKSIVFPLHGNPEIHITTGAGMSSHSHHRPRVRHMPSFTDMRSKTSVEHLILARHSNFVPTVSTRSSYSTLSTRPPTACSFRPSPPAAVPRSESYQNLLRQNEELRHTHAHEIEVLVQRLDRLESVNNRWLNTLIPLIERLARRLPSSRSTLSTYKSTSELPGDATPTIASPYRANRKHCSYPQHHHSLHHNNNHHPKRQFRHHLSSDHFTSDDSLHNRHFSLSQQSPILAAYSPNYQSQYYSTPTESMRNTSDASSHYWDPSNDDLLSHPYSQGVQEVAVDRLPSRHAGESLLGGDFRTMFASRVREVESRRQQQQEKGGGVRRERLLSQSSQLSGMETLEPVMRELVEEVGGGEEGELRGVEDPVGGHG
ncbi:hypothetical protein QBC36DRAFT_289942 [Triangularia setosa]|uniref:Uncharacterized protein n=1 Tax=Triangularia setosa TaxID=2587417 RepID=A0AAN6W8L6_9PEZI|nr:hypothetical protein QBC36DRAFT_289942 [Podospora setosa]